MSNIVFKTVKSLKDDLSKKSAKAHKETINRLIDKLHDIEYQEVYKQPALWYSDSGWQNSIYYWSYGGGLGEYERTYDLYDVIGLSKIGSNQYQSIAEIKPIIGSLSHEFSMYQHDTPFSYPIDEEMYLNIIEGGISSNHSMFGQILPRPFWDKFLEYCDENYDIIFSEEMDKL